MPFRWPIPAELSANTLVKPLNFALVRVRLADGIVEYRNQHGCFEDRAQLRKVPKLGHKAYVQAAGFLRIRDGRHPLDNSAVHPESYPVVEAMASDKRCTVADLMKKPDLRGEVDLERYVTDKIGMPTLTDILAELDKPGRDPRKRCPLGPMRWPRAYPLMWA